jgi:hypothetical protein
MDAGAAPTTRQPTTFYVDPLTGSMANTGLSRDAAWSTLAEVFKAGTVFQGGDTIELARGYHGAPVVRGTIAGDGPPVRIVARAKHTPLVQSLSFSRAAGWDVVGPLTTTKVATPPRHPDAGLRRGGAVIDNTCAAITLRQVSIYGGQDSTGWTASRWLAIRTPAIYADAPRVTIDRCHAYNLDGVFTDYKCADAVIQDSIIENFSSDGLGLRGAAWTVRGCAIFGSHKVDDNHNDGAQAMARNNCTFVGNFVAAYVNPLQRFLAKPGVASDMQGFGAFDGPKRDWLVANNFFMQDHPIGCWGHDVPNWDVLMNTVLRCGPTTFFTGAARKGAVPQRPSIALTGPKVVDWRRETPVSGGCRVVGNIVEQLVVPEANVASAPNCVLGAKHLRAYFVSPAAPSLDLHLKPAGVAALTIRLPFDLPPAAAVDFDGQPIVGRVVAAGALQPNAAYTPFVRRECTGVETVPIALGVDVSWDAPPPSEAGGGFHNRVPSYEVVCDGKRVGLQRTGATTWFVIGGKATDVYRVFTLPRISM